MALAAGATVRVPANGTTFAQGAKVSVMLRPEVLNPGAPASADGRSLTGTLTDKVYEGATERLVVALADGTEMVSLTDAGTDAAFKVVGATVGLSWASTAGYVLEGWPEVAGSTTTDVDSIDAAL